MFHYKYQGFLAFVSPIDEMKPLSHTQHNHILFLLDAGNSAHKISFSTGIHVSTISRLHSKHHPHLLKPSAGRPSKLSSANIRHALHLITAQKAKNAVQVTKTLRTITNQPLSAQTVRRHLKVAGMKAVVKRKR